jgi:hypothetical protein
MSKGYRRLHLLVEGQTEEIVVTNVFKPYLEDFGWCVTHSVVITKRPAGGASFRGGMASWAKLEREITLLLRDSDLDVLTTLFDFYGFPSDSPGMTELDPRAPARARIEQLEKALAERIADPRFLPNLILHELETWVFAAAEQIGALLPELTQPLKSDLVGAGEAELINDGPDTAPSKRLLKYCPRYSKTNDGPLAIADLGLDRLRELCPHLNKWFEALDARLT